MRPVLWLVLLLSLLFPGTPTWAGNTHTATGDTALEQRAWWGDALSGGYVVQAPAGLCLHSTSASVSASIAACRAYALNTGTPRQLEYIEDMVPRTIAYTAGAGTYWLIAHATTAELVPGWTRIVGTHYLWQVSASQPALPTRGTWLLSATVSPTAITSVTDRRTVGSTELTAHSADTTGVHGIADTAALLTTTSIGSTVQAFDADLSDLADGSLTGTKVGFADTDNNWTATNLQAALEELDDVIGGGVPNQPTGKVDWSQLVNVPAGFADGVDASAAGGSDSTAIHDNEAGEIVAIADKATPVAADHLLIEDSAAGNAKKDITIGSLLLQTLGGQVTSAQVPLAQTATTAGTATTLTDGTKGDFTCTSGNCLLDANSVALGTDTTGNYVAGVTANQGLLLTGTEGGTLGLMACTAGQILKNVGGTTWGCAADSGGAGGPDPTAIHTDVAGEIAAIADKATPVAADHLVIEDSAAGNAKKDITIGSLKAALEGVMLLQNMGGAATDAQIPDTITAVNYMLLGATVLAAQVPLAQTATALAANGGNCAAGSAPLGTDAVGAVEGCTPMAQTLACASTDKLRAYNAVTGAFTCAADTSGASGDITTAVSLATSRYVGDSSVGRCEWAAGGEVFSVACNAAKTETYTSDIVMYADDMNILNSAGEACQTFDSLTGLVTYHTTGACVRPMVSKPFDAAAFNAGAGVTRDSVALNGWPGAPALIGPDSDAGTFALVVESLWQDYAAAGLITLSLTCHSLTNQNGLTLVTRVGVAVCQATGEALPSFTAPTGGQLLSCVFGNQTQDRQQSATVTLTTTGCAAGEKLLLPFASEADMTATWSTAAAFITGGMLRYESVGATP